MEVKEKGCVYFFRHVGLEPIKIGFSSNPSPLKRFNQFKTYAPFGAEIIGFIQTDEAREIEQKLHLKYASKRLDGEWFMINESEVKLEIEFYSNKEDVKNRNNFQIEWAKKIELEKEKIQDDLLAVSDPFEYIKKIIKTDPEFNRSVLAEKLGISRTMIYKHLKKINL
jgi:hypothetical protein